VRPSPTLITSFQPYVESERDIFVKDKMGTASDVVTMVWRV
jgi:hypothetical protein